ncbi:MAG: MFS transporter [Candidatus Dormiibacterota bacterium]
MSREGLYRTLWSTPAIRGQAFLGLFAQVTQGAAPIGLVLVTRQATGSLAIAGAVSAALWLAAAAARPVQGRIIDRRGTRPVMLVCGPVHAAALIGLVAVARSGGSAWLLVLLSGCAGLALPPVSSSMRVEWGRRLPASERTAAYSLVFLTQELAILLGPLLVAALVAVESAGLALVVAACVSGGAATAFGIVSGAGGIGLGTRVEHLRRWSVAMPALLGTTYLIGCALGALQVATPALALARGIPAIGGVLIAALSVGGITGALLYGAHRWTADPSRRLLALLCCIGIAAAPLVALPPVVIVGLLLALVGLAVNPAFTTLSLLVDRHGSSRAAEAFGWMSTAVGGGTATGNAAAGALAQHEGLTPAFLAAALAACAAVLVAVVMQGRLRRAGDEMTLSSVTP